MEIEPLWDTVCANWRHDFGKIWQRWAPMLNAIKVAVVVLYTLF